MDIVDSANQNQQGVAGLLGAAPVNQAQNQMWSVGFPGIAPAPNWLPPQLFQLPGAPNISNEDYMARYFNIPLTYGYGAKRFLMDGQTTLPPVYIPPPEYLPPPPPPIPVYPPPAPVAPPEGGMPPPPDQGEIQLPVLPPIEPVLPPVEEPPPIIEDLPPPIVERPVIPELPPIVETPPLPPVEEVTVPVVSQPLFPPEDDIITLPPYERGEIPVPMVKESGKRPVIEMTVKDTETGETVETSTERPFGVSEPSVIPIEPIEIPPEVPGIEVPEIPPLELPAMPPVEQATPPAYIGDELMPPDESEFAVYGDIMKDYTGPGLTDGPDLYGRPVLTGGVGGDIAKGYEGPGIEEIPGVFAESGETGAYLPEAPTRSTRAQVPAYTVPEADVLYGYNPSVEQELAAAGLASSPQEILPAEEYQSTGVNVDALPGLLAAGVDMQPATSGLLETPISEISPELMRELVLDELGKFGQQLGFQRGDIYPERMVTRLGAGVR